MLENSKGDQARHKYKYARVENVKIAKINNEKRKKQRQEKEIERFVKSTLNKIEKASFDDSIDQFAAMKAGVIESFVEICEQNKNRFSTDDFFTEKNAILFNSKVGKYITLNTRLFDLHLPDNKFRDLLNKNPKYTGIITRFSLLEPELLPRYKSIYTRYLNVHRRLGIEKVEELMMTPISEVAERNTKFANMNINTSKFFRIAFNPIPNDGS